jgi:hypothetical protein
MGVAFTQTGGNYQCVVICSALQYRPRSRYSRSAVAATISGSMLEDLKVGAAETAVASAALADEEAASTAACLARLASVACGLAGWVVPGAAASRLAG